MALESMPSRAQENVEPAWNIPNCANVKVTGKKVNAGMLRYVVPGSSLVRKVKDVDYQEYRIFERQNGRLEVLILLIWGVNASPFPSQSYIETSRKYSHRVFKLPNGNEGIDARGMSLLEGNERLWRIAGVMGEFARYSDVSAGSAEKFDAIIDSVCYQPTR